MAKNLVINVDNAITGTVELWASEPLANGTSQTMPVFILRKTFKNGTITLNGLQEIPAGSGRHYRLIVRPYENIEGSHQYRFYLPTSVTATVQLTYLIATYPAW